MCQSRSIMPHDWNHPIHWMFWTAVHSPGCHAWNPMTSRCWSFRAGIMAEDFCLAAVFWVLHADSSPFHNRYDIFSCGSSGFIVFAAWLPFFWNPTGDDLQLFVSACFVFQNHHFSCGHTDKHCGSSLPGDMPDAHWFGGFLWHILPFHAACRALQLFWDNILQDLMIQAQFGIHLLQSAIFYLQFPKLFQLIDIHAPIFCLPFVIGRPADAMLPAKICDWYSGFPLIQYLDDLTFAKPALPHFGSCLSTYHWYYFRGALPG